MAGCFQCFGSTENVKKQDRKKDKVRQGKSKSQADSEEPTAIIGATTYTFEELEAATKNFRQKFPLGKGGFGCVYKGRFESTGKVVAVKQLYRENRKSLLGRTEFLNEVQILSSFSHTNLVNLIGYCAKGDQRFLVYESMPLGSLKDHLHDLPPNKEALDWNTRMKIAAGAAKGLEYLHDTVKPPPVIYRDFNSSNILLDEGFHPKLSDFELAKLGPVGDKTQVMGYCAPEYAMEGQFTQKSEVYSWGVVFLELITGRKAIDNTRAQGDQNLVAWARSLLKNVREIYKMADPLLQGGFSMIDLRQALVLALLCLQENPDRRPLIRDIVKTLSSFGRQDDHTIVHHHLKVMVEISFSPVVGRGEPDSDT